LSHDVCPGFPHTRIAFVGSTAVNVYSLEPEGFPCAPTRLALRPQGGPRFFHSRRRWAIGTAALACFAWATRQCWPDGGTTWWIRRYQWSST